MKEERLIHNIRPEKDKISTQDEQNLSGDDLEEFCKRVFTKLGLRCFLSKQQIKLASIDQESSYTSGQHTEFDFLIPHENICIVGEITARKNVEDIKKKYKKFRVALDTLRRSSFNLNLWKELGIDQGDLRYFRQIQNVLGVFIVTKLEAFDLDLEVLENIHIIHKSQWRMIIDYANTIGNYGAKYFLNSIGILKVEADEEIKIEEKKMVISLHRKISSDAETLANLFTFQISPYRLIEIAEVFRRDNLPTFDPKTDYQRPLMVQKLSSIRRNLIKDPDFMFPNDILIVMSNECNYSSSEGVLRIPKKYGSIAVLDGQHRLFSYANESIKEKVGETAKILVTAISFPSAEEDVVKKYSARIFVEINTNQTSVARDHIDAIAYQILGQTHPRALAAHAILLANTTRGALNGLIISNRTGAGVLTANAFLTPLKPLFNISVIRNIRSAEPGSKSYSYRRGYEELLLREGESIESLLSAETLVERGKVALIRYSNLVKKVFKHDWPERHKVNTSSLAFAKVFSGLVRLFVSFVKEGMDWDTIKKTLENIRNNIMHLRGMETYDNILLLPDHSDIPGAEPTANDDFKFFDRNRKKPTSILTILEEKSRNRSRASSSSR